MHAGLKTLQIGSDRKTQSKHALGIIRSLLINQNEKCEHGKASQPLLSFEEELSLALRCPLRPSIPSRIPQTIHEQCFAGCKIVQHFIEMLLLQVLTLLSRSFALALAFLSIRVFLAFAFAFAVKIIRLLQQLGVLLQTIVVHPS